jgi:protein CpxP
MTSALLLCIGIGGRVYACHHDAYACHHDGDHPHPMREMMQQLDLTDSQRQQIHGLMAQHRQNWPNRANRGQMHDQMLALISAPEFNQQAASDLADQMALGMKQHMLQRMETRHAIYQILNEDQRSKFVEHMQQHRYMMESRGPGRGK